MLSLVRSPIRRFFVYRFFTAEGFVFPVVMLLLLDRGLSLGGMGIATGAFFAGTLMGEIPTGYVGDRIGRRNGLLASSILIALTHVAFSFAATLVAFVAIYWFWGVAATFRSGTTDAWLYDALAERDETGAFTQTRGRSAAMYYASAGITAIVGGTLYELDPRFPFIAAAVWTTVGAMVCATLPEPDTEHDPGGFTLGEARVALTEFASNPTLRAFVLLVAATLVVMETLDIFVQPISRDVLGMSPTQIGPLYAALLLVAAGASDRAEWVRTRFGIAGWFWVAPILMAASLVVAVWLPLAAIPAFFLGRGLKSLTHTLASTYLNDRIASSGRATVLSAASMVYALTYVAARAVGGELADQTSALVAMAAFGVASVVVTTGIRLWNSPFS